MSTESGIPDFRSATGLYKNCYHAEEMLSHHFFVGRTREFYEFYREKMIYPEATANSGHLFMAELEKEKDVAIVTQNIDGLHQLAGSSRVYELHGSIHRNYCQKCHKFFNLKKIIESDDIPYCDCGGLIKPDVVLYEEGLDSDTIEKAIEAIENADLLIICGTSLNVYPANSFIHFFKGKTLAIINKDATSQDKKCDIVIHDSLGKVFKQIKGEN